MFYFNVQLNDATDIEYYYVIDGAGREENAKYNFGFDDADKNCITTSDKVERGVESG